jgi:hypothetical protein
MLVAAFDDGRLYTWENVWPETVGVVGNVGSSAAPQSPTTWVHALRLTSRGTAGLVASQQVRGYASGFAVDGGTAYAVVSDWAASGNEPRAQLVAIALEPLAVASSQSLGRGWASLVAAEAGKIFLQSGWPRQELLVYGAAAGGPAFEQALRAPGWPSAITVADGKAYVATGSYGVAVFPLDGVSSPP